MYEGHYRLFTFENLYKIFLKASEGDTYFNPLCKSPDKEYKGENICAYNVADAMIDTKKFLTEAISSDSNKWIWGDIIYHRFKNTPWSVIKPLRPYFDRHYTIPSNGNTLWIGEYKFCKDEIFEARPLKLEAFKATSYAHILTFEPDQFDPKKNTYGVTGGLNEFPLQGNYDEGTAVVFGDDMWQMKFVQDIEDGIVLKLEPESD